MSRETSGSYQDWTKPSGYTVAVYDGKDLEISEEADSARPRLAGLLQSGLYSDTRLEVTFDNLEDSVRVYCRALSDDTDLFTTLSTNFTHAYLTAESQHPLERFSEAVETPTAARRIEAKYDRGYYKHLSFKEAHQTHDRPKGAVSNVADITPELIARLDLLETPLVVQWVLQPLAGTSFVTQRDMPIDDISEAGVSVSTALSQQEISRFDSSASMWLAAARVIGRPDEYETKITEAPVRYVSKAITQKGDDYYSLTSTACDPQTALHRAKRCYLPLPRPSVAAIQRRLPMVDSTTPVVHCSGRELASLCNVMAGLGQPDLADHRETKPLIEKYRRLEKPATLAAYRGDGPPIGHYFRPHIPGDNPITVRLPDWLRRRHVLFAARPGGGKTVTAIRIALYLAANADHPVIIIDPKGELAYELTRIQFRRTNSLENVEEINLAEETLQLPLIDIRQHDKAGKSRSDAIDDVIDGALQAIRVGMGYDDMADPPAASLELLKILIERRFRNGADVIDLSDILDDITAYEGGTLGGVQSPDFQKYLDEIDDGVEDVQKHIGGGARRLLSTFFIREALEGMLNRPSEGTTYDFANILTSSGIHVLNMGQMSDRETALVAPILISRLWQLGQHGDFDTDSSMTADVIVDEAHRLMADDLLQEIVGLGRSSDVALTMLSQSMTKFTESFSTTLGDEVGTTLTTQGGESTAKLFGPVTGTDPEVALVENTPDRDWLCRLKSKGDSATTVVALKDLPLPAGHSDSTPALDAETLAAFKQARASMRDDVRSKPSVQIRYSDRKPDPETVAVTESRAITTNSTLPRTEQLPDCVEYHEHSHTLTCTKCGGVYKPTLEGLTKAIQCHTGFSNVSRKDIPIVECPIQASPQQLAGAELTAGEAVFLQLVHKAGFGDPHPMAFDSAYDSFTSLREMAGIDTETVNRLRDRDLVSVETQTPHTVYGLTSKGRSVLNIERLRGRDVGPYVGDLNESATHRMLVKLGEYLLQKICVQDPTTSSVDTRTYYPVTAGDDPVPGHDSLIDTVTVDSEGNVVSALEAERNNNDHSTGAVNDFKKLANLAPEHAIWIVENRQTGISVNNALHDADLVPRAYEATAPRQMVHDEPGCTAMYTASYVKNSILFDT